MADPSLYLPPIVSDDVIKEFCLKTVGIQPRAVKFHVSSSGQYHRVYEVAFNPVDLEAWIPNEVATSSRLDSLILRVAGNHFTEIKTRNEVDILSYLRKNTSVPVPAVLWHDVARNNMLGCEYTILTHVKGQSFDAIYRKLKEAGDEENLKWHFDDAILPQITNILIELTQTKWQQLGGLREVNGTAGGDPNFYVGPQLVENFWHVPELERFWDGMQTYADLNPGGPFSLWTELELAKIEKYVYMIRAHSSLQPVREHLPRIEAFSEAIRAHAAEIDNVPFVLSHRDLHMGNLIYDTESRTITGVIDWEFAAVVPAPRADASSGNLLWDGYATSWPSDGVKQVRTKMKKICEEKRVSIFNDAKFTSKRQEGMMDAVNYLRAVTEVLPRGEVEKDWKGWVSAMLKAMDEF